MLVFSSAEITNSSSSNGLPSHWRAYRSSMRPALSAKLGSRGKIQLQWYQGRMASWCNQRQSVLPLMDATKPDSQTSRARSVVLQRDNGKSWVAGSSHAQALT